MKDKIGTLVGRWRHRDVMAEGPPIYADLARSGLIASGARFVNVAVYDPRERLVSAVAWAATPRSAYARALTAARRIVPGTSPAKVRYGPDANPVVRAVHVDRRVVVARLEESALNITDRRLIELARRLLGLSYSLSVPLKLGDDAYGALSFLYSKLPTARQREAAETFAQHASARLEGASPAPQLPASGDEPLER